MIRSIVFATCLMISFAAQPQQKLTGIFVPIKCSRHVDSYLIQLSQKQVCLPSNPILSEKNFESVSNLIEDANDVYFELTFTQQGYATLVRLQNSFPYTELALMVEGEVFMIFTMSDKRVNRTFRFQSQLKDRDLFLSAQTKLTGKVALANQ
jgi:hypothetical protein